MTTSNKKLINVGLSVWLFFGLFGCKTRLKPDEKGLNQTNQLEINQLNLSADSILTPFTTLAFSGKVEVTEDEEKSTYQYKLHFYRDSLIWCSISLLGIEGIRIKMTKDSLWLVDRLNKQYLKGNISLLRPKIGLALTIRQLQQLFLGELPAAKTPYNIAQQESQSIVVNNQSLGQSITCVLSKPHLRLKLLNASDERDSTQTQIEFAAYQKVEDVLIPNQLKTQTNKGGDRRVTLKHLQIKRNPETLSFNFNIPSGYEPME
jgi:hypothetical protein